MSSKARALREKNVVTKLVKDLNKRMEGFEAAVDELKILKESITDMHDEVTAQQQANGAQLAQLKTDLKDNKIRILNEAAASVGKVIMSRDEVDNLTSDVAKLKADNRAVRDSVDADVETKVAGLIEHRLTLQSLEQKAQVASLEANCENYRKEIENLGKTFDRMSEELKSQKELTSSLALANRPSTSHTA